MNILVTGSNGFIGKNLVESLKNLRDGKDRTRPGIAIEEIIEVHHDVSEGELQSACERAHFIFHLAGVNRPKKQSEYQLGNTRFTKQLIDALQKVKSNAPIMFASSIQASLEGRYKDSIYGESKREAEKCIWEHGNASNVPIYVFRLPNVFGKWCRPNYNSVIATFCYAIANNLPYQVNDEKTEITLLYIDDLVSSLIDLLEGKSHRCDYNGNNFYQAEDGKYCYVPKVYSVSLGEVINHLLRFENQPTTLLMPELVDDSFEKKLFSTYLSYLPREKVRVPFIQNIDERGSFTELLKTKYNGQFSVNISKPGVTKGQHWHNSKWEIFIVVSGHALIQERRIGTDETGEEYPVIEFEVSGEKPEAVYILPGYTHNIINLSQESDLVTLMWANEMFDPKEPDTFFEIVNSEE